MRTARPCCGASRHDRLRRGASARPRGAHGSRAALVSRERGSGGAKRRRRQQQRGHCGPLHRLAVNRPYRVVLVLVHPIDALAGARGDAGPACLRGTSSRPSCLSSPRATMLSVVADAAVVARARRRRPRWRAKRSCGPREGRRPRSARIPEPFGGRHARRHGHSARPGAGGGPAGPRKPSPPHTCAPSSAAPAAAAATGAGARVSAAALVVKHSGDASCSVDGVCVRLRIRSEGVLRPAGISSRTPYGQDGEFGER